MKRIMIIDDSDATRASIECVLIALGHQVVSVENGLDALKELKAGEPFDLLITDIFMPEMDGIEVIEKSRQLYPDMKIIAISAGGMGIRGEEMLAIASDLGAQKVVKKPFSTDDLSAAVTTVLQL
ncbi:MAG: response regulator [Verrucomicrobiota bacterium]